VKLIRYLTLADDHLFSVGENKKFLDEQLSCEVSCLPFSIEFMLHTLQVMQYFDMFCEYI